MPISLTDRELKNKLAALQGHLQGCGKVAVAFSGGVDSTLLLRVATDTLGPENVTALHVVSCLIPVADRMKAEKLVTGPDGIHCQYRAIQVNPLSWQEFVANSEQRCYFCKKRMYGILQAEAGSGVHSGRSDHLQSALFPANKSDAGRQSEAPVSAISKTVLFDGTNTDDLQEHRPGLQAVRELSVGTPLVQARLNKKDIRALAGQLGLINAAQPSNSCLATRIPVHQEITKVLLERIARAEQFFQDKGLLGCRVKPGQKSVLLQVLPDNLEQCAAESFRYEAKKYLQQLGFDTFFLDIKSRDSR